MVILGIAKQVAGYTDEMACNLNSLSESFACLVRLPSQILPLTSISNILFLHVKLVSRACINKSHVKQLV